MKTSPNGRALIEAFEGLYLKTYYDSVHVLTIGYGHTNLGNIPPHIAPGDTWTTEQADEALSNDLVDSDARVDTVASQYRIALNQAQHDALASFEFNTGHLAHSSIPSRLQQGDTQGAMNILLQYCHAGGNVLNGLVRRRRAERLMFLGQVDDALVLAGAHVEIVKATNNIHMAKAARISAA
jgi:lysozyme